MSAPLLCAERLTKRFGGVTALNQVDFALRRGEIHALLGENGAGKSTLVKTIGGLIGDYQGQIRLRHQPVRFRGTRDDPGVVLGLDRGGSCIGMAFQVAPHARRATSASSGVKNSEPRTPRKVRRVTPR